MKRVGGSSKTTFTLKANVQFMFALHFHSFSELRVFADKLVDFMQTVVEKSQAGCWRRTVSALCLTAGWCRVTTFNHFLHGSGEKRKPTAMTFRDLKG